MTIIYSTNTHLVIPSQLNFMIEIINIYKRVLQCKVSSSMED